MKHIPYLMLLISTIATASAPAALIGDGPHPDAPEALMEYGQLVGNWQCKSLSPQPDGSWKQAEGVNTWTWYYVLDGRAIQDVWKPTANADGKIFSGTNQVCTMTDSIHGPHVFDNPVFIALRQQFL